MKCLIYKIIFYSHYKVETKFVNLWKMSGISSTSIGASHQIFCKTHSWSLPLISKFRSRSSRNRVSLWNFSIWSVFFLLSWRSRSLSSPALTSFWLASLWLMDRLSTCLWSLCVENNAVIYLLEGFTYLDYIWFF